MIFLINGKARSGKDTMADYIVKKIGAKKVWFAKPLKDMGIKYFGLTNEECYDNKTEFSRRVLQSLGTTLREEIDKNFWVNMVIKQISEFSAEGYEHFVISDCRYKNEIIELCAAYDKDKFSSIIEKLGNGDTWKNYQINYYGSDKKLPPLFYDFTLPQTGCTTIKINRGNCPTIEYGADHVSENDLNDFPFEHLVENNKTLEDLYKTIDDLVYDII